MKIPTETTPEPPTSETPTESPIPVTSTEAPTPEPSTESPGRKSLYSLILSCHNRLIWHCLKWKNSIENQT